MQHDDVAKGDGDLFPQLWATTLDTAREVANGDILTARSAVSGSAANHDEACAEPRAPVVSRRFLVAVGGQPRWMPIVQR
jgi:hypothetical protein